LPLFAKAIPKIHAISNGNPNDQKTTPGSRKNILNCERISVKSILIIKTPPAHCKK